MTVPKQLSTEEAAFFAKNGYLQIDRITSDDELDQIRALYDEIIAERQGIQVDFQGVREDGSAEMLTQVFSPELQHPELLETGYFRNAQRFACQLLGIDESELTGFFTHMIFKPPGKGRDVPWHQDEAYWDDVSVWYNSLSVWMPLDPVTVESGCMQFIPGSHRDDVLRYRHVDSPDREPLVLDEEIDTSTAVACPLPAGGATFHHCRTLHFTAQNTSQITRRAIAAAFHGPTSPREERADRPWLETFRASLQG